MRFDRVWLNARLATLPVAGPRRRRERRRRGQGRADRLCRPGGGSARRLGCGASGSTARAAGSRPASSIATPISSMRGDRAHEFELRLNGASYEEIARAGGGIVSTVKATRAASEDELVARAPAAPRRAASPRACTTIEIKSGYGLDLETEARMLRAARRLARASRRRRHHLPRRARAAAGGERRQGRLSSTRSARDAAGARPRRAGRCGRRLLRGHRVLARADGARLRLPPGARAAGQAACRPALEPARRGARRRATARCRPITSNTRTRTAPPPWRRPARSPCCCPAPSTCCARRKLPPVERSAGTACHGARDRLQSRHLAADLAAARP